MARDPERVARSHETPIVGGLPDVPGSLTAIRLTPALGELAVLIAATFSMYNRMVDGLRATTPPTAAAYRARAVQIADHGYNDPSVTAVPR